jgi:hypothetical protein
MQQRSETQHNFIVSFSFYLQQLRLPREMKDEEKEERVEDVIDELGLRKCCHSLIGQPGGEM